MPLAFLQFKVAWCEKCCVHFKPLYFGNTEKTKQGKKRNSQQTNHSLHTSKRESNLLKQNNKGKRR